MDISTITLYLFYVRDNVKVFHWSTTSFAAHKASDDFVTAITEKMDKLIETLQASRSRRIEMAPMSQIEISPHTELSIVIFLKNYRNWLYDDLTKALLEKETDLISLKDDMISDVNQLLYLLTFK